MTRTLPRNEFKVGQRVSALANTVWDEDLGDFTDSDLAYVKLHGHHGHVVAECGSGPGCNFYFVHVHWEGTHDGRKPGPTQWTDSYVWHMDDDEIEYID